MIILGPAYDGPGWVLHLRIKGGDLVVDTGDRSILSEAAALLLSTESVSSCLSVSEGRLHKELLFSHFWF